MNACRFPSRRGVPARWRLLIECDCARIVSVGGHTLANSLVPLDDAPPALAHRRLRALEQRLARLNGRAVATGARP